jgi:hypothetical protein
MKSDCAMTFMAWLCVGVEPPVNQESVSNLLLGTCKPVPGGESKT